MRGIDDAVPGAQTQDEEPPLHNERRGFIRLHVNREASEARAVVTSLVAGSIGREISVSGEVCFRERTQSPVENSGDLSGKSIVAPQIGTMGEAFVVEVQKGVL